MNPEEAKAAARRARNVAASRTHRKDLAVRAREAEERRQRRQQAQATTSTEAAAAARARDAEAKRARRQADPEAARAREAAAKWAQRQADAELRAREAEAARKRRQADLESARARDAAAKRLKRALPEVAVPPTVMRRNAAMCHNQSTSCEMGLSKSTQDDIPTPRVSRRMQTNKLKGFHKSSSTPKVPLQGKEPVVPTNSRGASCAVQGHAKVDDTMEGDCRIKMAANTSSNLNRGNPSSRKVCIIVDAYGCAICSRSFEEQDALFLHVLACPLPEPFHCGLCSEHLTSWGAIRDHLTAHIKRGTAKCPLCGHTFGKQHWTIQHHILHHHMPVQPFVCNCCGRAFFAKSDIHTHSGQCLARMRVLKKYLGLSKDSQARSRLATTVHKRSVCPTAYLAHVVTASYMPTHLEQVQQSREGEGQKKHPFDCVNDSSDGTGPPKVKQRVEAFAQCFIKVQVAHKATYHKTISEATQAELHPSTVSSSTQCDLED